MPNCNQLDWTPWNDCTDIPFGINYDDIGPDSWTGEIASGVATYFGNPIPPTAFDNAVCSIFPQANGCNNGVAQFSQLPLYIFIGVVIYFLFK